METKKHSAMKAEGVSETGHNAEKPVHAGKKIRIPWALKCSCWTTKLVRAHMGQLHPDSRPSKKAMKKCYSQFLQERDECEACQHNIDRSPDKCTCQDAYKYLMSLFPPIQRPTFPTEIQVACAELDWSYERMRCLYCKEHATAKKIEEDLAESMKKMSTNEPGWAMFAGAPVKIIMKEVSEDEAPDFFF